MHEKKRKKGKKKKEKKKEKKEKMRLALASDCFSRLRVMGGGGGWGGGGFLGGGGWVGGVGFCWLWEGFLGRGEVGWGSFPRNGRLALDQDHRRNFVRTRRLIASHSLRVVDQRQLLIEREALDLDDVRSLRA